MEVSAISALVAQNLLQPVKPAPAVPGPRGRDPRLGDVQTEQTALGGNPGGGPRQEFQLGRGMVAGLSQCQTAADGALGDPVGEGNPAFRASFSVMPGITFSWRVNRR